MERIGCSVHCECKCIHLHDLLKRDEEFQLRIVESIKSLEHTLVEQVQHLANSGSTHLHSNTQRRRLSSLTGLESAMGNLWSLKNEKVREKNNFSVTEGKFSVKTA